MKGLRIFLMVLAVGGFAGAVWFAWHRAFDDFERPAPAKPTAWTATEADPTNETPAVLWNGRIGLRIGRAATGWNPKSTPLPAFLASAYQAEGEEKIQKLASPLKGPWTIDGTPIGPQDLSGYRQTQDFRTGALETQFTAKTSGGRVTIKVRQVLPPESLTLYEEWTFWADHAAKLTLPPEIVDIGFGYTARLVTLFDGRPVTTSSIDLPARRDVELKRMVMIDAPADAQAVWPEELVKKGWSDRWASDIEIEGPVEDQQAIRSMLFALKSAVPAEGPPIRVAPLGLGSELYFGHVFWDADVWVAPALSLLEPASARQIAQYRLDLLPAAKENARLAATDTSIPFGDRSRLAQAAMYPWESSVSGKETVPGPSRKEHHITGTVAWSLQQAADLGLIPQERADEVGRAAANFWLARSVKRPDGKFAVTGVMSPDESHIGDNDLYTNMLADWCIRRYAPDQARDFYLPRDKTTFLTYDKDALRGYKQTAALLTLYPLQDPRAEKEAKAMIERFVGKASKNGPAMSDSVESLILARQGKSEEAYATWRKSWYQFMRGGLRVFSEKRISDRSYFLTGAGGCIQAVLYGFAGLRLSDGEIHDGEVGWNVKNGRKLALHPHLPAQWKQMKLKGIVVLGKRYDVTIRADRAEIQPSKS